MDEAAELVAIRRGPVRESVHRGHVAVCDAGGALVAAWGDPEGAILPRSAAKPLQALPLVESGAAAAAGLGPDHLALACASHAGAPRHVDRVAAWLDALGLDEAALACGAHLPGDPEAAAALTRAGRAPTQLHNNCSGKHAGFLTLAGHLGAAPEGYLDPDHPVQRAVAEAWADMTGEAIAGHALDGCSAPNHVTTLAGLARAMARFAAAEGAPGARAGAATRLLRAMIAHPDLVAGEGRACTDLMRAAAGRAALKTGAEGVYVAILPGRGLGVALKISDGATRAAEAAIAALLVRFGAAPADHPAVRARCAGPIRNWRGLETGRIETSL